MDRHNNSNQTINRQERKPQRSRGRLILVLIASLIIVTLTAIVIIQQLKLRDTGPDEQEIARQIQERVSQLMILPGDEEALVSEISNANEVNDQPFFADVEDGDQVLVFLQSARIVIYRPSTNMIVNVGPIVDDSAPIEIEETE